MKEERGKQVTRTGNMTYRNLLSVLSFTFRLYSIPGTCPILE